jgi:hypothetical protein
VDQFLVCVSDRLTDILSGAYETTTDVWCYRVEADNAHAAVEPAIEQWRAEVGERTALSLSVSRMPAPRT